ncbi:transglutaminase domain-containing protein [Kytococcus schroeteri]|nr:transglutaminase domain-containing protein [Kytococcus schroeteri]
MSSPLNSPAGAPHDGARPGTPRRGRPWERTQPVSALLVTGLLLTVFWPATHLFADGGWWGSTVRLVLALVATSAVVRLLTGSAVLGSLVQGLVALVWLLRGTLAGTLALGVLPTPATATAVAEHVRATGELLAVASAPVPADPSLTFCLLALVALVTVLTDSAVHTARSVLVAAIAPLLVFVTLAANRTTHEPWWWFLVLALLFTALLALHRSSETADDAARGQGVTGAPGRGVLLATAVVLTAAAVAAALVVPATLPQRDQQLSGRGLAENTSLTTVDFTESMDLRADLTSGDERPVVLWHSSSDDPGPLRITATDRFADDRWQPVEGRAAAEVLRDPRAVQGTVPDKLPRVDWADVLKSSTEQFAVTATGIRPPFLATPSFPVDLRSPVAVTGDPRTDAVWVAEEAQRYEGAVLEPRVPEKLRTDGGQNADDVTAASLEVPQELQAAVSEANAEAVDPQAAPLDKARAMQAWLRNGDFRYSLDAAEPQAGESMVEAFLRERRGYCTQYATTMIMMARQQGIPARMAMGVLPGEETGEQLGRGSDVGPERLVRRNDAHAWPELYFEGVGWLRFEPTPSSRASAAPEYSQPTAAPSTLPSTSPSPSEASPSPSESSSDASASPSPSSSSDEASPSPSSEDAGQSSTGAPAWLEWVLTALGVLLLVALALAVQPWRARRARARVLEREDSPWSAAWEVLRLDLLDRGITTRAADTVHGQAAHLLAQRPGLDDRPLHELAQRVDDARYARPVEGGAGPEAERAEADALREQVVASLDATEGGVDRLKRVLFPASAGA